LLNALLHSWHTFHWAAYIGLLRRVYVFCS
jgi:hypothetical protein